MPPRWKTHGCVSVGPRHRSRDGNYSASAFLPFVSLHALSSLSPQTASYRLQQETKQRWSHFCLDTGLPLGNNLLDIFYFFIYFFSLQKDLKVLHEQFMVEKPKPPLKEPARFPRQHCDHLAVPLPTVSALPMGLLRSDTMLQRCSAQAEHQEPFCSHGVT